MDIVQFVVLGLGLGATYAGVGTGLLLTYRATGIVNFAQTAIGMWGVFVFVELRTHGDLALPIGSIPLSKGAFPVVPSLVISLVYAMALGVACYWLVFRPLRRAPELGQVVGSVALMLTLAAWATVRFSSTQVPVEALLPRGSVDLLGTTLSTQAMSMAAVMAAIGIAVWAYLRFTRVGIATNASAENAPALELMGFSPHLLATIALGFSAGIAALGMTFGASLSGLSVANGIALIVPGLAVLLVARLRSVGLVVVSALALGAFQSVLSMFATKPWWPYWAKSGLEYVLFFLIIIVILLISGRSFVARGTVETVKLPDVRIPRFRPIPAIVSIAVAAAGLILLQGSNRYAFTMTLILTVLAISFVVIVGYLGQVSLAQLAFAGAAGFCLSKLTLNTGIPFPLTFLISALAAAGLGVLVALPALRIRGSQLAIVTLAAALVMERFIFGNVEFTPVTGNLIEPATLFGLDLGVSGGQDVARLPFSIMVLVVLVLIAVLFVRVASGITGRIFLAVRANERSAASSGVNVRAAKLIGFALAAFIAGVAGTLIGSAQGQISASSFSVTMGLTFFAVAYLGGITSLGGAVVAGIIAPSGIVYGLLHQQFGGDVYALVSGILMILTAILNPVGIAGATRQQLAAARRFLGRRRSGGASGDGVPAGVTVDAGPAR
jgi:branched-chain amino acid transport system permease protein